MQILGKALGFDPVTDARVAEADGFDGVRVIDHFFSGIPPEQPVAVPHAMVSLTAAAAVTKRVLLTQTVMAATMRHPFELAQAISCLDRVSNGRAELGIGAGWLLVEHERNGLLLGSPRERVDRLVEVAQVCRTMFHNSGCVDFRGTHFTVFSDAPWPETPHVPEIMIGAHGKILTRRVAPWIDRLDLLEAMSGGKPSFSGEHSNDSAHLVERIGVLHANAVRDVAVSATVNLHVLETVNEVVEAQRNLAAIAQCDVSNIQRDLLRVIDTGDGVLKRLRILADLGVDRLHIRPKDGLSLEWLRRSLSSIKTIA